MRLQFTGHPFVDAGIAGLAALLEDVEKINISTSAELTGVDVLRAMQLGQEQLFFREIAKEHGGDRRPFFYFLLQEVMPGSPWDQVKSGSDVPGVMRQKFETYVETVTASVAKPSIGRCFLSGGDAHLLASKTEVPMLASGGERPNGYPNLADGLAMNGYLALAILFAPLGIEKTVNLQGKGGPCIIYHTADWRFMVEVARRNIRRLRALLAVDSIEDYRKQHYRPRKRGAWKSALLTTLHVADKVPDTVQGQIVIWSFNASNQSCRYENAELANSFLVIHRNRRLEATAYREAPHCSDLVSRLLMQGRTIVRASLSVDPKAKGTDRAVLRPTWSLQRLYAIQVLHMPGSLLNAIEAAADHLSQDAKAVDYCLFQRPRIAILAKDYKLSAELCSVFADYSRLWPDYLRAAVAWKAHGHDFPARESAPSSPGAIQTLIKDVTPRIRAKHPAARVAIKLSARVPRDYRQRWLELLRDGACTYDDFLAFNPLDEALSFSSYSRTRVMKDYLIAYLLAVAKIPPSTGEDAIVQSTQEPSDSDLAELENLIFADEELEETE